MLKGERELEVRIIEKIEAQTNDFNTTAGEEALRVLRDPSQPIIFRKAALFMRTRELIKANPPRTK